MRSALIRILLAASALALSQFAHAVVCSAGDSASVLKVNEDQTRCYIKYDGYGDNWNEWVGEDRIRVKGKAPAEESYTFNVGDPVEVKWKGTWYPASVLSRKGGKYKIHYDGYGSNWDEWVGNGRIKAK